MTNRPYLTNASSINHAAEQSCTTAPPLPSLLPNPEYREHLYKVQYYILCDIPHRVLRKVMFLPLPAPKPPTSPIVVFSCMAPAYGSRCITGRADRCTMLYAVCVVTTVHVRWTERAGRADVKYLELWCTTMHPVIHVHSIDR